MFNSFRIPGILAITLGAALAVSAGFALAAEGNMTADQIIHALNPEAGSRGLSLADPVDPKEHNFVDTLRDRPTRSLSVAEREQIAKLSATKRKIDFNIQFEYGSARISSASLPMVEELGKALSDPVMKALTFVVAGHTDAVGGDAYNQDLSERRADAIKRYLMEKYGVAGSNLVAVGFGKTKLKDPSAPTSAVNRRVQVVNLNSQTASE